ncbi:MAG: metal ABC transporter ATP-binding protein [Planctomycetota bacterium]|jgi:zinc transport system ATP-binding protein|nr:metal ABC transporter ATP-binding protein [Planctomycetota bacterium]
MTTISTTAPAVTLRNVTAVLGGNSILDNVSLVVPRHGNTAIIGPNGAGKTTLLLTLLGKIPCAGEVSFPDGKPPRIGYVPQKLNFDAGIPVTVLEFICLNWRRLPVWFGVGKRNRERALRLLDMVGAAELWRRWLGALSGGELRRVLLASALGREPDLLVLDEPTSGVDFKGEELFHELLRRLRRKEGFTQIMVCHNLGLVRRHATLVACLNRGIVAAGNPEEMLSPAVLTRTFIGPGGGDMEDPFASGLSSGSMEASHA